MQKPSRNNGNSSIKKIIKPIIGIWKVRTIFQEEKINNVIVEVNRLEINVMSIS